METKQNSLLSTCIPSADGGGKKEENLIEVCIRTQNELAGKAGLGGKG